MLASEFHYLLPPELIAHAPLENRDQSRLLRVETHSQTWAHHIFAQLPDLLQPGDVLVFNDTQVIKARLFAKRKTGGSIEVFLLKPLGNQGEWQVLLNPARRLKIGEVLTIAPDFLCVVKEKLPVGFAVALESPGSVYDALEQYGHLPLPLYIHPNQEANAFQKNYQTIMAKHKGAVAAPTAGLHFTEALLTALKAKGIQIETVTLHVGYGTFQPMSATYIQDHHMHAEYYELSAKTAQALNQAKQEGRRILAVGTTSARTLETVCHEGRFEAKKGETALFIYPGYRFGAIQGLITNFHLPQSTLLLLVAALIGKDLMQKVYQEAIAQKYRFYSFGDGMLLLP